MLKNYLKTTLRRLWKMRGYSFISIGGMAVALACCLLLLGHVRTELSFDQFHEKADRIYRLNVGNLHSANRSAVSSGAMAPAFCPDFPEVEKFVRFRNLPSLVERGELQFYEDRFFYTDSTVFEVFDFELLEGDKNTMLDEPFSLVLTESAARKYFGDRPAVGQQVEVDNQFSFQVTGILKEVPEDAHFKFDFLGSVSSLRQHPSESIRYWQLQSWYSHYYHTYLLLRPGADAAAFGEKIERIAVQYSNPEFYELYGRKMGLYLQPLTDIHLNPTHGELEAQGNMNSIYIFGMVALFILFIACSNYANLATALALFRNREIGVRKVLGAGKGRLSLEFLGESLMVCTVGLLLSFVLIRAVSPAWSQMMGRSENIGWDMLPLALVIVAVTGILGGLYPAIISRSFHPATIFRKGAQKVGGLSVSKGLLVLQFAISIGLIVAALTVKGQLNFMQNQPLGMDVEQVVVLPTRGNAAVTQRFEALENELKKIPEVTSSTISELVPGEQVFGFTCHFEGMESGRDFPSNPIGYDYFQTYQMDMTAGRPFDRNIATDTLERAVINEALAAELGWADPQEAIGKRFDFANDGENVGEVIGVVKNAHFHDLRHDIQPMLFFIEDYFYQNISVRLSTRDMPSTLASVEQTWKQFFPDLPFDYFFADEHFGEQYAADRRLASLFSYFVGLAIVLACLGLFGLSTFSIRRRVKEIGIRKILGATTAGLVALLSKDFFKLIGVALFVAFPVAYFFMEKWLQDFAFRIDVQWWFFMAAGVAALSVAFATIAFQSIKAALANPVESLRNE